VDRNVAFIWIVVLFVLEINHFRWIWWTYWIAAAAGAKITSAERVAAAG
jgi:hypothetical protein